MAKNTRLFSDIDLSFEKNPVTKDIFAKYDDNAIKNSVKNLILTKHYERPFHSEIGSNVNNMLFEHATPAIVAIARQEIIDVINNFEPRVEIIDVEAKFNTDANEMFVRIVFRIRNTQRPITVELTLDRTR
jgi:phage baseplate assembly protein W